MNRILDIAEKDLRQMLRDLKTFMFFLLMPVIFTLLFGYIMGGGGGSSENTRLPVVVLNQDGGMLSHELSRMLAESPTLRLVEDASAGVDDLEKQVEDGGLAAVLVIPAGYSEQGEAGTPGRLTMIVKRSSQNGDEARTAILEVVLRLARASQTASIVASTMGSLDGYSSVFDKTLTAWEQPPVRLAVSTSMDRAENTSSEKANLPQHTSPGMMLQFAIAGLLVAANVIVNERKSKSLQRLLTTSTALYQILLGHFAAIFSLIFTQFCLLVAFGQMIIKVDYLNAPAATLVVMLASALCISALGLLIGVMAKTDEQAIIFSLIPMFLFSGLGGAWVPLEVTGKTFQAIGHISPVAWAMDGFKNITLRGLGLESVIVPSLALLGYALLFFALAAWRLKTVEQ